MKKEKFLIRGRVGQFFTKSFLKSRFVKMVSEGDFLARLNICCKIVFSAPIQFLWMFYFFYARVIVKLHIANPNNNIDPNDLWLYKEQILILNIFITIQVYHLFIMMSTLIVVLNMTMSRGVSAFTIIFNFLFLSEALLYGSFLFILDWVGLLHKFNNPLELLIIFKTQWIWLITIIIAIFSFLPLKSIFKDVNMWNREWIRIDCYRKTEDRENGFIFKTWVAPGEIKARRLMISSGWLLILIASLFHLIDVFATTQFNVLKYIILGAGYFMFLSSYIVPYNQWSLIFYWTNMAFLLAINIYGLYIIQNVAHMPLMQYNYLYVFLLLPLYLSIKSSICYTWTIKDRQEIKAIALNTFSEQTDFANFVEENEEKEKIKESEDIV